MTLFNFQLKRGAPIVEQVVHAAKRAILLGEYRAEQPFPSVRAIASGLKIHPNTAHKAVQILIEDKWLEARVGTGTLVAGARRMPDRASREALRVEVEQFVVLALGEGLSLDDVIGAIRTRWAVYEPARRE